MCPTGETSAIFAASHLGVTEWRGNDAIKRSPFKHTWIVGFANGAVGYVADSRDYEEETYASHFAPKIYGFLPFKPNAWEVMAEAGVAALNKL